MTLSQDRHSIRSYADSLTEAVGVLRAGLEVLVHELRHAPEVRKSRAFVDVEGAQGFLQSLELIGDTMPPERFRDAIRNVVKSIHKAVSCIPRKMILKYPSIRFDPASGRLDYLARVIQILGPEVRIAPNDMTAWIRIDPDDGKALSFTQDSIIKTLKERGVVFGIDEERIQETLLSKLHGEEVAVAKGVNAVQGRDGRIEYKVKIDDLNYVPKALDNGSVSFKDIELFSYVQTGDVLAEKVPPTEGRSGSTVTGKRIDPLNCEEAEFPECENAKLSEDSKFLLAAIDGAVTKRGHRIFIDPTLRVPGDVSYQSGNIESKVTVMIGGDVLSGFQVRSERDITIASVVEGAQIEAKGDITIKGGIEGGGKAVVEANGNIAARYISNATVTSLQNIIVESGIIQSTIWAGGRIIVSGRAAEIIGGQIDAD